MHQPRSEPRYSIFYDYRVHPFRRPPEMDGGRSDAPVVIVGAGPVGMICAIDLARYGIASIVLESELQVSLGSRALALTRRTLEILQQSQVIAPFLEKGLQWQYGRTFYRGNEVYRMVMPHDPDDRYLPALNLQQQYMEQFLVEAIGQRSGLIDLRWGSHVTAITQDDSSVTLTVDTPEGAYSLTSDWVIAADGGRSAIRRMMDLRMEGRAYAGNFVIVDIRAKIDLPTERICHFDPDWNPGNNLLVHKAPDDIWRLDFRLPDGETPEQALEQATLAERIGLCLKTIGQDVPWELDWATVYSASTLTLADYVHRRVLFTGDAAHLLPIFGVRGANTGFQDAANLAWKLALVIKGDCPRSLLDTYSQERVAAAREICEESGKSTRFMTPPTQGFRLMREAVLSLTLSEEFPRDLLHWRTSRPHDYLDSPLNSASAWQPEDTGIACGAPLRNVRLGTDDFLLDHMRTGFHLLAICATETDAAIAADACAAVESKNVPLVKVLVSANANLRGTDGFDVFVHDDDGRVAHLYGEGNRLAYLVRPDMHVCARWKGFNSDLISQAMARACGHSLVQDARAVDA